ncbi:hypothetical protein JCM9279_007133 [Rhodotorula babjevae]
MPRRLSGNLHAPGDFAARVRAVVREAGEHISDPVKQQYIIDSGKGLCNTEALTRFETLDEDQRERVLSKVDDWRDKLLRGEVKRADENGVVPEEEEEEEEEAAPAQQPRLVHPPRRPPPRKILPSEPRALVPSPHHAGPSSWASPGAAHLEGPPAEFSPPVGETLHYVQSPHVVTPHAQIDYVPQQASRTRPRHDYPHDPTIFCPSCDPFDEPPPFVQPAPTVYHPQQREQRDLAQHVLYRPLGEGDEYEQRQRGEQ